MTDTLFCYSCRKHHPKGEMTLMQSKGFKRWRCLKSLAYGQSSRDQRDAFGKTVSAQNRLVSLSKAMHSLPRPVLELFVGPSGRMEGLA